MSSLILWTQDKTLYLKRDIVSLLEAGTTQHRVISLNDAIPAANAGDIVVAMGAGALKILQAQKIVPKGRTVTSQRNHLFTLPSGVHCLVTYSAEIVDTDYEMYVNLLTDINSAIRYTRTGSIKPVLGDYRYVNNFTEAIKWIEARYKATGKPVPVAWDSETLGLDQYAKEGYIITVQITYRKGAADVVYFPNKSACKKLNGDPKLKEQINWLFTSPMVLMRGANLKYDINWSYEMWGIKDCTNFGMDTLLVGSLLDENRSNSLKLHTKIYVPDLGGYSDEFDKKYDKSRMDLVPKEELLLYAGGDTDACYQVAEKQKIALLKDKGLTTFYNTILHPAARAYEQVERVGWSVNWDYYEFLKEELEIEIGQLQWQMRKIIGGRIVAKHLDKTGNLNMGKASMLKDFMFSPMGLNLRPKMWTPKSYGEDGKLTADKTPSTAYEHLVMFEHEPKATEFVKLLKQYMSATKTYTTYVIGFMKHRRLDGKFHPTFFMFSGEEFDTEGGTVTGRLSVKSPAIQCLRGSTPVLTDRGYLPIQSIVEGDEEGVRYQVLTHTGKWKPVIGSYRNGLQPVFSVLSESGRSVDSTANHPYLTQRGWVRTDQLKPGDICYELRAQDKGVHQPNILLVDSNEESLQQPYQQGLESVRWQGDTSVQAVAGVQELSGRYGREAGEGLVNREEETESGVHPSKLHMGDCKNSSVQQIKQQVHHTQGSDQDRGTVGYRCGDQQGEAALQAISRYPHGGSLDENAPPNRSAFQAVPIVSITPAGECETYDLTIEDSHSFVANGVVVHNTIPKHTAWAKRLRYAFIAPPGFLILANDYSQGELKIVACVAGEENMIRSYQKGIDLHAVTAARLSGYALEDFLALKLTNENLFEEIRYLGKAGNFGLLYGMGAAGFQYYAEANYGVKMSLEEAEANRDAFFELYPGLIGYHERQRYAAKTLGYVRSPLGRVRRVPLINSAVGMFRSKAGRQAINSPIQATLSDIALWSAAIMWQRGLLKKVPLFGMIHDQNLSYVPEKGYEKNIAERKEIMENLPFHEVGWNPVLKFTVDSELGTNLGELKKYKLAA
jgi:DNA polymerase I-like protein with 3'-5' exonuclease and polymerase domains